MNPFDWRGPNFLLFYFVLAIVTIVVSVRARKRHEREQMERNPRRAPLDDPYLIASLRDGPGEVVRLACVSLLDRGLLKMDDWRMSTTDTGKKTATRRPIEQKILTTCTYGKNFQSVNGDKEVMNLARAYDHDLERLRFLADAEIRGVRRRIFGVGAVILALTAAIKVMVAFSRGRTNVGFLIFGSLLALFFLIGACFPRRTVAGDTMLDELKNLFQSLKLRPLRTGGVSNDVVLLAAVYGATALPVATFPWANNLRIQPTSSSSSGDGSSSSSCGSSCGGGCGGGCGGCGS